MQTYLHNGYMTGINGRTNGKNLDHRNSIAVLRMTVHLLKGNLTEENEITYTNKIQKVLKENIMTFRNNA
jgi:hypothetical protein